MTKRILVIEDEPQMLLGLRDNLELEGYEVVTAADARTGWPKPSRRRPTWSSSTSPCRARTGSRSAASCAPRQPDAGRHADRAIAGDGEGAGARARRRRLCHQTVQHHRAAGPRPRRLAPRRRTASGLETCRIGDIEIDFRTHQAHRGAQRIDFTAREFDLLRYLVGHTGQVVTREQILNQVWGYEESPTTRTIDNFVAKLRQKIEKSPHEPEHILTVHGAGYKFVG